jgi:heme/copper-type cytochrome/quinol oxidase subunit 3
MFPVMRHFVGGGRVSPGGLHAARVRMWDAYWHLVDLIWIYLFPMLYLIH